MLSYALLPYARYLTGYTSRNVNTRKNELFYLFIQMLLELNPAQFATVFLLRYVVNRKELRRRLDVMTSGTCLRRSSEKIGPPSVPAVSSEEEATVKNVIAIQVPVPSDSRMYKSS